MALDDTLTMAAVPDQPRAPVTQALSDAFLRQYPRGAARRMETMAPEHAADILAEHSPAVRQKVWSFISPATASLIMSASTDEVAVGYLMAIESGPAASVLLRLEEGQRARLLAMLNEAVAEDLRELMTYPMNTAGHMMDARVLAMNMHTNAAEALRQLRLYGATSRRRIYTLDNDMRLYGQVELEDLVAAEEDQSLAELSGAVSEWASALDPRELVAEKLQMPGIDALPVVDIHQHVLGVIRGASAVRLLKENISADLQQMVGAGADERALSTSWFAVKKRQPWLQINLLTGFLAAAVVGVFESTIAQFTVLAVLMPVVAGQSGNTGAQALAVTMRGIILREITGRQWAKVMSKEAVAGLLNGIAIALTCGIGVWVWSRSGGLALVVVLAMVISMTIAGIAGALVPIILKRCGLDPAQSSSIFLTVVTDIAGFLSFLGIATLLADLLV